jgi:hypothetical protein
MRGILTLLGEKRRHDHHPARTIVTATASETATMTRIRTAMSRMSPEFLFRGGAEEDEDWRGFRFGRGEVIGMAGRRGDKAVNVPSARQKMRIPGGTVDGVSLAVICFLQKQRISRSWTGYTQMERRTGMMIYDEIFSGRRQSGRTMYGYGVVIWLLLVAAAIIWGVFWEERRSNQILKDWAAREGLKLLFSERRHYVSDEKFKASRSQAVFRVKVQDGNGFTRQGWVKCGGWWAGLLQNRAEVKWD